MGDKLKDLKNFLADADRKKITDDRVQEWVTELRRAMYDATDILDLCKLKAMERGESTADNKGCCNPFLFCIRNPFHAHDMGTRIKALNERLNSIKQRGDAFSFINLEPYEGRGRNMHASRETSGELDRSGVVGEKIEEDTRALVAEILQTREGVDKNIIVFAIVGVGGIGKTTLAQNVFNNESIQSEFEKKIWLSINQNFDKPELLKTAITLAGGNHRGENKLAVLQPILTEALKGKKFLLVMDDLWSHGAWEDVLKTTLVNAAASGSRVLITTRHEAVARGMTATWPHHHIDRLSLDDAWSLLKKQAKAYPNAAGHMLHTQHTHSSSFVLLSSAALVLMHKSSSIEEVFNQLCPPSSIENIGIYWYFGQKLPCWMMSTAKGLLNNLKFLLLSDLPCCTQLPDGLCHLPGLQVLNVDGAPCIKRIGTEFLRPSQPAAASFPMLSNMELKGMVEWEEWEWEEKVQAMPRLEELLLENCKLGRVPPGLASNARALRKLSVHDVKQLSSVEKFPSVVELTAIDCPDLESITNLPKVQKLTITRCWKLKVVKDVPELQRLVLEHIEHLRYLESFPSVVELTVIGIPDLESITNLPKVQKLTIKRCWKLKVVKDVPELQRLVLEDALMKTLPGYLREVNPSYLELGCSLTLLTSIAAGESGPEFAKFSHVDQVKAKEILSWGGIADLHVLYTRKPYSFDTNVNPSFLCRGTLPIFDDAQKLESVLKMPRRAFDYVCSLVKEQSLKDMNEYTFLDGRPMRLEDRVAVALIVLNSADPPATIGSSVGVNESTLLQVTKSFVRAMGGPRWPGTNKMEKIKSKFDKIYGLPNCCGVVHKTRIPFVSQNSDHEKNEDPLMQVVVDSDMRFTDLWFVRSHSENQQLSTFQDSRLFMMCKRGDWLNGSKLKVLSDGSEEVGEYIIGDAGYPLLPWLLIPYEEENALSESETEFNKRHSEATAIAPEALARWKDTWKWLQGGTWCPEDQLMLWQAIRACCSLHNIVIEMEKEGEEEELPIMPRNQGKRQLAYQNAARTRDILSQHLLTSMSSPSGVNPVDQKEQPEIVGSSGSGEKVEEEKRC